MIDAPFTTLNPPPPPPKTKQEKKNPQPTNQSNKKSPASDEDLHGGFHAIQKDKVILHVKRL